MSRKRGILWQAAVKARHSQGVLQIGLTLSTLAHDFKVRDKIFLENERKIGPDGERVGMIVAEHPSTRRQRWPTCWLGLLCLPTHVYRGFRFPLVGLVLIISRKYGLARKCLQMFLAECLPPRTPRGVVALHRFCRNFSDRTASPVTDVALPLCHERSSPPSHILPGSNQQGEVMTGVERTVSLIDEHSILEFGE